ncbi:MAG: hypothetical protein M3P49_11665 [Actinomycetota bacterium]|nr:hypothetical protein [Actinomycetota bacterium]
MYAIEWPYLALDHDRERVQGRVRNRLVPLLRDRAGFRGLLVLVRGGIESTRYDPQTGKSLRFDCCGVRCLALWDEEVGMLRAEEDLTGPLRNELGRAVLRPERRARYEVVYRVLPGAEADVYGTVTEAKVKLEDLEEAIRRTVTTVAPALSGEPGFRGVLVLRDYDDLTARDGDQENSGTDPEPALPGSRPGARRAVRAYQHWCVSLWETRRRMEEANELALRSAMKELSDLLPRGWWVDRANYEGAFLP